MSFLIGMRGPSLYERIYYYCSKHRVCNYRVSNSISWLASHFICTWFVGERNAGQKYKYQILFKLRSCKDVELILYSDQLYKCMSAVFFARYIEKHREYYRFRYQDKVYTIPKEEVETIEFTGSWNIGWW